jgi:high-affinity nickel-transport protein
MVPGGVAAAVAAAAVLGFRHGVDYDHIAAITDLTAASRRPSHGVWLAILYGLGHSTIVTFLGALSIAFGMVLPKGSDKILESVVGFTLIVLGIYVLASIVRGDPSARPATRFELIRRTGRWLKSKIAGEHTHHDQTPTGAPPSAGTAFSVGIIHGIGAETPTQLGLFVLSAGIGGWGAGLTCVLMFAIGLLAMNALMAVASAGMFHLSNFRESIYRGVMILTGGYSLIVGALFLLGGIGMKIPI